MEPRKAKKIRPAQRQRISMKLILATGVSVLLITLVLVIYFQFMQNEVSNAKNVKTLTPEQLPVDMVVDDTLNRNGSRYKVAKPLTQTPVSAQ
jgi:hypothetical protein